MAKDKKRREDIRVWKEQQRNDFLATLPFAENIFRELFEYLDIKLETNPCSHDFKLTTGFLKSRNIAFDQHIDFFIKHGGGCDCESLMNMEGLFQKEHEPLISVKSPQREILKQLQLPDFVLELIPAPWKLFKTGETYEFQFGNNKETKLTLTSYPHHLDWINENSLKKEWEKITELKVKSDSEAVYDRVNDLELAVFKTKDWIPVLVWIRPATKKSWGLLFHTSLARLRGDMNELKNLLKKIK